jgi:hypothetical protein
VNWGGTFALILHSASQPQKDANVWSKGCKKRLMKRQLGQTYLCKTYQRYTSPPISGLETYGFSYLRSTRRVSSIKYFERDDIHITLCCYNCSILISVSNGKSLRCFKQRNLNILIRFYKGHNTGYM